MAKNKNDEMEFVIEVSEKPREDNKTARDIEKIKKAQEKERLKFEKQKQKEAEKLLLEQEKQARIQEKKQEELEKEKKRAEKRRAKEEKTLEKIRKKRETEENNKTPQKQVLVEVEDEDEEEQEDIQSDDEEYNDDELEASFPWRRVFIVVLIIAITAIIYAVNTPLLNIKEIKLINLGSGDNVKTEDIRQYADTLLNQNIITADKSKVNQSIKQLPFVRTSKIKAEYPATVLVEYTERIPYLVIDSNGQFVTLDKGSNVLDISDTNRFADAIIIKGINTTNLHVGDIVEGVEGIKVKNIIYLLESIAHVNFAFDIENIEYDESNEIKFSLKEKSIIVVYGEVDKETMQDKLLTIEQIIYKLGDDKGILDASQEKAIFIKNLE